MKHLPAEPHDLVVAVTLGTRAEPEKARDHDEDLGQQPQEAGAPRTGHDTGNGESHPPRNMIEHRVDKGSCSHIGKEEYGESHPGVFDVNPARFRISLGNVDGARLVSATPAIR